VFSGGILLALSLKICLKKMRLNPEIECLMRSNEELQAKRVLPIAVKALFLGMDTWNGSRNRDFKCEHVVSLESLCPSALVTHATINF